MLPKRRMQEAITLAVMKMATKLSRTRSLRKVPKSSRLRRATRNLERILSWSLGKLWKSTLQWVSSLRIPGYRKYS